MTKDEPKAGNVSVPSVRTEQIPNRGEFVAAISAAIAEDMGKDVSSIRILSIKKIWWRFVYLFKHMRNDTSCMPVVRKNVSLN